MAFAIRHGIIADLSASADAGLHRLTWNLRPPGKRNAPPPKPVAPGDYAVRLKVGDKTLVRPLRVEAAYPGATSTADDGPVDP